MGLRAATTIAPRFIICGGRLSWAFTAIEPLVAATMTTRGGGCWGRPRHSRCCPLVPAVAAPRPRPYYRPLVRPVPTAAGVIPRVVCPVVLVSIVLFRSSSALHGSFPLVVSQWPHRSRPIAPHFHPASSCSRQWLGVLLWWWLPLWLGGCRLVIA